MREILILAIILLLTQVPVQSMSEKPKAMQKAEAAPADTPFKAGGQCRYKKYAGDALITSVRKRISGQPSLDSYDVKFSFKSSKKLDKQHLWAVQREYILMDNSKYPDSEFLQRYGIKEGALLDCRMHVIIQGTCAPIIFEFPDISRN